MLPIVFPPYLCQIFAIGVKGNNNNKKKNKSQMSNPNFHFQILMFIIIN